MNTRERASVSRGADHAIKNNGGRTAADLAQSNSHGDLATYIGHAMTGYVKRVAL